MENIRIIDNNKDLEEEDLKNFLQSKLCSDIDKVKVKYIILLTISVIVFLMRFNILFWIIGPMFIFNVITNIKINIQQSKIDNVCLSNIEGYVKFYKNIEGNRIYNCCTLVSNPQMVAKNGKNVDFISKEKYSYLEDKLVKIYTLNFSGFRGNSEYYIQIL